MTEFNGPIVEGAYYEREGRVVGPAQQCESGSWWIGGHLYRDADNGEHCAHPSKRLTRRVYITHTNPAEVVAELWERSTGAHQHMSACTTENTRWVSASRSSAMAEAADLVAEKLVGEK